MKEEVFSSLFSTAYNHFQWSGKVELRGASEGTDHVEGDLFLNSIWVQT